MTPPTLPLYVNEKKAVWNPVWNPRQESGSWCSGPHWALRSRVGEGTGQRPTDGLRHVSSDWLTPRSERRDPCFPAHFTQTSPSANTQTKLLRQGKGCFQPYKTHFFWMLLTQAGVIFSSTLFAACVVTTSWQQILDTRLLSKKVATVDIFSQLKLMWVMEARRKTQNFNIKRKLP